MKSFKFFGTISFAIAMVGALLWMVCGIAGINLNKTVAYLPWLASWILFLLAVFQGRRGLPNLLKYILWVVSGVNLIELIHGYFYGDSYGNSFLGLIVYVCPVLMLLFTLFGGMRSAARLWSTVALVLLLASFMFPAGWMTYGWLKDVLLLLVFGTQLYGFYTYRR